MATIKKSSKKAVAASPPTQRRLAQKGWAQVTELALRKLSTMELPRAGSVVFALPGKLARKESFGGKVTKQTPPLLLLEIDEDAMAAANEVGFTHAVELLARGAIRVSGDARVLAQVIPTLVAALDQAAG